MSLDPGQSLGPYTEATLSGDGGNGNQAKPVPAIRAH